MWLVRRIHNNTSYVILTFTSFVLIEVARDKDKNLTRRSQGNAEFAFEPVFLRDICVGKKAVSGASVHVSPEPASNLVRPGGRNTAEPCAGKDDGDNPEHQEFRQTRPFSG